MATAAAVLPAGRSPRQSISTDDLVKRGLMVVISLYLVVALSAPLLVMRSKSVST